MGKKNAEPKAPHSKTADIVAQKQLQEAYEAFTDAGCVVQRTKRNSKHTGLRGVLRERETHVYSEDSTGYVMIVPSTIISVDCDVDNGKQGAASLERLFKDLGYEIGWDEPTATTITTSGGSHTFFKMPEEFIGIVPDGTALRDKYPDLDIYSDCQTVHPIAGTRSKNKLGGIGTYTWATDKKLVLNDLSELDAELVKTVFMLKERGQGGDQRDYDDELTQAVVDNDMPLEELTTLLKKIDPNKLDYEQWLNMAFAVYDRFGGSDEGAKVFDEWSSRGKEYNKKLNTLNKWNSGHFVPNTITYKHLRYVEADMRTAKVMKKITKAKTNDDINSLVKKVAGFKNWMGTRSGVTTDEILENIANAMNIKLKELKATDKAVNVVRAATLKTKMEFVVTEESVSSDDVSVDIYNRGGKYTVIMENVYSEEMARGEVSSYLSTEGIKEKKMREFFMEHHTKNISDILYKLDYTAKEPITYGMAAHPSKLGVNPVLVVKVNPVYLLQSDPYDEAIAKDFNENVWGGMLEEYVKTMALTSKFGAKLKMFALIAPSNSGKTTVANAVGAVSVGMGQLLNALTGGKGLSKNDGESLKNGGHLVVNEMDTYIPDPFKELADDNVNIGLFGGQTSGSMKITLATVTFTAIHHGMLESITDEFDNRVLQFVVHEDDTKYNVLQSPLYKKDPYKYKTDSLNYVRQLFIDTIMGDDTMEVLNELQRKHRITSTVPAVIARVEMQVRDFIENMAVNDGEENIIAVGNDIMITATGKKSIENFINSKTSKSGVFSDSNEQKKCDKNLSKAVFQTTNSGALLRKDVKRVKHYVYKDLFDAVADEQKAEKAGVKDEL